MISEISEGVVISVETFYQPDYSNPTNHEFMFAYRITIENSNAFPIKLHRRHWFISDSDGSNKEVEGEGVDPRHADQVVRGTVMLPHGTGKTVSVLVVCK